MTIEEWGNMWKLDYASKMEEHKKEADELEELKRLALLDYVKAQFAFHNHMKSLPLIGEWKNVMDELIVYNNSEISKKNAIISDKAIFDTFGMTHDEIKSNLAKPKRKKRK